ncbi:MAG: class I SAM-dependent methyltransferase [Myxococcales bacterium]|nr:class I SAM-dependent methyltransferase [Myxococcales bacterium]
MSAQFWDERYRAEAYAYGREPNEFLRAEAHRIEPGRVLCLAEGEGRNAVFLAGLGHLVTAVDFSTEGLRKAERLAREQNVAIATVHADLATYAPETDAFTAVVAIFAHLPPPVRKHVHGWIPRALRSGGVFILEAYTPAQLAHNTGGPRDAALLMTLDGLREELAPLTVEVGREVVREINEGAFHGGLSATVQLVASRPRDGQG